MVKIDKTQEPDSWTQHRLTPGADYEATDDLRNALLKDQGYICAYCMRRIPIADKGTTETSHIEHIIPRSALAKPEEQMDYSNMVICCPGAMTSTKESDTHCDRHKKEKLISFTPFQQESVDTISYSADGSIKSSDPQIDTELNTVLNLNIFQLKANRKAVICSLGNTLQAYARKQAKKRKGKATGNIKNLIPRNNIQKLLDLYKGRDVEGRKKEYCGVAISYLTKKLGQYP